jgi:putative ABC transport system ATP-binding protein
MDVMSVFQDLNEQGITVVLVTHESDIAQYAKRIIQMRDGRVRGDRPVTARRSARDDLANFKDNNSDEDMMDPSGEQG